MHKTPLFNEQLFSTWTEYNNHIIIYQLLNNFKSSGYIVDFVTIDIRTEAASSKYMVQTCYITHPICATIYSKVSFYLFTRLNSIYCQLGRSYLVFVGPPLKLCLIFCLLNSIMCSSSEFCLLNAVQT